jgi:NAD(P)-dependent dehydrogenase (short-subunit alcohol dehydrogenase family)
VLEDKTALIYGAGGAIGGAVARSFAREGARLFLTGRDVAKAETVAEEIVAAGGKDRRRPCQDPDGTAGRTRRPDLERRALWPGTTGSA